MRKALIGWAQNYNPPLTLRKTFVKVTIFIIQKDASKTYIFVITSIDFSDKISSHNLSLLTRSEDCNSPGPCFFIQER